MHRAVVHRAVRPAARPALSLRATVSRSAPRRFASSAPADKPRSWRSLAARWGLAVAAVYYYNVNSAFADDLSSHTLAQAMRPEAETQTHTVESLVEQRRLHSAAKKPLEKSIERAEKLDQKTDSQHQQEAETQPPQAPNPAETPSAAAATAAQALEDEAGHDGAFNPETGEINWDCPCLGGMAHGPCGEEFKTAFSCFVYSTEEPKGMDCIEKFQTMQDCFRKHPDIYGAELDDEEPEGEPETAAEVGVSAPAAVAAAAAVAAEPVQSLEPVVESVSSGEPPLAEFQTLREDHAARGNTADGDNRRREDAATTPWTDNTKANKIAEVEKAAKDDTRSD